MLEQSGSSSLILSRLKIYKGQFVDAGLDKNNSPLNILWTFALFG